MSTWPSGVLVQIPDHLDKFRQGDPDAFESHFRLHQRVVYGRIPMGLPLHISFISLVHRMNQLLKVKESWYESCTKRRVIGPGILNHENVGLRQEPRLKKAED